MILRESVNCQRSTQSVRTCKCILIYKTVVVACRSTTFRSFIIGSSGFVISDDSWVLTPPIETANTTGLKGVGGLGMSVSRLTSRTVSLLLPLNATQSCQ